MSGLSREDTIKIKCLEIAGAKSSPFAPTSVLGQAKQYFTWFEEPGEPEAGNEALPSPQTKVAGEPAKGPDSETKVEAGGQPVKGSSTKSSKK